MEHFVETPAGAACADQHGAGFVRPDGWRKVTQPLQRAEALAGKGQGADVTRTRCMVAAKRVAAHLGLKAADLLLLDTLAAFTQPQDWEAGQRPLVWASNAYLIEQTGFSLSTLKRHARKLATFGLISFQDSPNGKRWGYRDTDGRIVQAYGFDLSPLAARVTEFEDIAARLAEERQLCQRLKRQITITRRKIRALLEALAQQGRDLEPLWAAFERLLRELGHKTSDALTAQARAFATLLEEIETKGPLDTETVGGDEQTEPEKMDPKGAENDPHARITIQLESRLCNADQTKYVPPLNKQEMSLDLKAILRSCPEFANWAGHLGLKIRNWKEMCAAATELCPMLGVSEQAWVRARDQMGYQPAAASLALIFDKVSSGEVASPGGYLRGMAAKAEKGTLHLERSFFGRLQGMAA